MLLRDVASVRAYADELATLAREQSFPYWLAWATVRHGWVLAQTDDVQGGIARTREGLAAIRVTGAELSVSYVLAQLAEAHGRLGSVDAGIALLDEALALTARTNERWYEPELHRLRGELLGAVPRSGRTRIADAMAHVASANDLARRHEATSFELRAAVSWMRLARRRRGDGDARATLAGVYGRFTEGFETADLAEARTLLVEHA